MKNYTIYTLRVNPQLSKEIFRTLKIDGSATLDDLRTAILSAFQFDNKHLYMFSMNEG